MELVRTATADGLRLDGALWNPGREPVIPVDAAILLHGVGGNFYGGTLFNPVVERLNALNVATYRVNTRGHDGMFVADTITGRRRFGAANEIVDECRLDISAWINHAKNAGFERIALLGHSLGAIKAAYSQAHELDPNIRAIILMSPPRLSHAVFIGSPQRKQFLASMAEAEALVDAGRGDALFGAGFPVPLVISGNAFVDKYGPAERYNIMTFLERLQPPTLVMYGEREIDSENSAFANLPNEIRALPDLPSSVELNVIGGADHFYSGVREEAAEAVLAWLKSSLSG